jgi:hypothetical protein
MLNLFFEAAWKVLVWGLVLGAGIPALFALGIRLTSIGAPDADGTVAATRSRAVPATLGTVCFVLAALAVALGIMVVVAAGFGKMVSFEHIYPTLVPKG